MSWNKVQKSFTLVIQESIGHLKTLYMYVLSVSSGVWVCMETLQLIAQRWKKTLALEYESTFMMRKHLSMLFQLT